MQNGLWLVVGTLVFAAGGVLASDLARRPTPLPSLSSAAPVVAASPAAAVRSSPTGADDRAITTIATPSAQIIAQQRAELDRTVWAKEVSAQEYEDTFIALWDGMRSRQEDQYRLLAAFPFDHLTLALFAPPTLHERGITVAKMATGPRTLDRTTWSALLDALTAQGYRLEHSEWHHAAFNLAADTHAAPTSQIAIKLFVANDRLHQHLVVNGTLGITWASGLDKNGHHLVGDIDATHLTMTTRTGPDAFTEAFQLRPQDRGLDAQSSIDPVLVYDLDGDGRPDIALPSLNTLLLNRSTPGHVSFIATDLCAFPIGHTSMESGPYVTAAVIADFNGDGLPDLLECGPGMPPVLFLGSGTGTFRGVGEPMTNLPAADFQLPMSITAGDILGNGRPDVWIGQYRRPYVDGNLPSPYWDANDGYPSFLLMNDGRGHLLDATPGSGLDGKRMRRNYSSTLFDLTGNGHLDLLTVNDFSGVDFFAGDGHGHFEDRTEREIDHRSSFGMSHAIADFDGDGVLDLFISGMGSTTARRLEQMKLGRSEFPEQSKMRMPMAYGNRLLLGRADHTYQQAPYNDLLARTGWSWGCAPIDTDNGGRLDIYLSNGNLSRATAKDYCTRYWTQDIYMGGSAPSAEWNSFFQLEDRRLNGYSWNPFEHKALLMNEGGGVFRDTAYLMNVGFEYDGREVVAADFDGDGHTDLLEVEYRPATQDGLPVRPVLHVYRNLMIDHHHWLEISVPDAVHRSPLGATVTVMAGGWSRIAALVAGDGFRIQHPPSAHFGLGDTSRVDAITVRWADGLERTIAAPPSDAQIIVRP